MNKNNPKIVAFLCTWCSYAGADLAGTSRSQYPPNVRVIRVPCSGRINPIYIIKALLEGADGVLVSGCHPGDCHYLVGNYHARRRFVVLKKLLTTAGFDADRVHFTWVSASEGARFADVIRTVTVKVQGLGASTDSSEQTQPEHTDNQDNSSNQMASLSDLVNQEPIVQENSNASAQITHHEQFAKQREQLISHCKELLKSKAVEFVIGFRRQEDNSPVFSESTGELIPCVPAESTGELIPCAPLSVPCFIDSPADVEKLMWDNRCIPTLSGYLIDSKAKATSVKNNKVAIVAKPCDARAIVSLIQEKQLKRDDIHIIGLTCAGMVSEDGTALPCCLDCDVRTPPIYDYLINQSSLRPPSRNSLNIALIQGIPDQVRDDKGYSLSEEVDKCILCYSCRQSCYGCYCETCFVDRGEPDWQTSSPDTGAKMLYHLGRAMHLSGRCVGCGACENTCASGVNVRYLIREVSKFIEDTYGYQSGMDPDATPAMLTYNNDDPEIGFLGEYNDK